MSGTNTEPFFQESKKLKRERIKWLTIVMVTNIFSVLLMLPSNEVVIKTERAWPESWVEVSISAEVIASTQSMVTVLNQSGQVIFPKAYLLAKAKECSSFSQGTLARFMVPANELAQLKNNQTYKALPYSEEFAKAQPTLKRVKYEVHF